MATVYALRGNGGSHAAWYEYIGNVHDPALGLDGAYLFAATDAGGYRLRLH